METMHWKRTILILPAWAILGLGLSGCADFFRDTATAARIVKGPSVIPATPEQTLCDVQRSRARIETLNRLSVEKFRQVALKVSQAITPEDVTTLAQIDSTRGTSDDDMNRQRAEIIDDIYSAAIIRAGFSSPQSVPITGTELSATVGIDSSGADSFAEFVTGRFGKDFGPEGSVAQVTLAANAAQTKYLVRIYHFVRYETQTNGTTRPIFTSETLFENAASQIPRTCDTQATRLDEDDFNTIPGLDNAPGESGPIVVEPAPPVPAPQPVPAPAPAPAPAPGTGDPAPHPAP
jgi:hypothetical protein